MSQEFHTIQPKFALGEFGMELVIPESLKNNAEMLSMLLLIFGVDEDVIDENHHEFVKLEHKD